MLLSDQPQVRNTSDVMATILKQLACANLLPMAATIILGGIVAWLTNEARMVDYLFAGHTFLLPILIGIGSARLFVLEELSRKVAVWLWIIPLIVLVLSVEGWRQQPMENSWTDVWNNFVGTKCSTSECLYELTTAWFISSAAYALTAFISKKSHQPID